MYSSMENLNNEDIRLLCNYRKNIHGLIEKESRSLDFTVVKELVNDLLAQGIETVNITKGLTRLTKLICRYVDTESLAEVGKVLPKPVSVDSNENRRRASSQSPTGSGSGMDVRPSSYTMSPNPQRHIPSYHALQSQQPYHAAENPKNTAKRRRVSGNEGLQTLTVFPTPIQQNNGNTTQGEGQHCSTDLLIHPEQPNSPSPLHVAPHGNLVPVSEQDKNMNHFVPYRDKLMVGQQLSASRSDPSRPLIDNADAQQPSSVNEDLPLPPNLNAGAGFTSYAADIVDTLDGDARLAFGLLSSP
jgi:hypothetical protein